MAKAKTTRETPQIPAVDDMIETGIQVSQDALKCNADATRKGFETMVTMGRDAFDTAARAGGDNTVLGQINDIRRANFEAMVEAGATFMKGVESFNGCVLEIARRRAAEGAETGKALAGTTSFGEAVEIQQDYVRKSLDHAIEDSMSLTNAWLRIATQSGQPLGQRLGDIWSRTVRPTV